MSCEWLPPPPFSVLVVVVGFLSTAARAADDSAEADLERAEEDQAVEASEGKSAEEDAGTPENGSECVESISDEDGALEFGLAWGEARDGVLSSAVELAAPDAEDLVYYVEYELHFAGEVVRWEDGPIELKSLEVLDVAVDAPKDAYFDSRQDAYASSLIVRGYAVGSDGAVFRIAQADAVDVLFSEDDGAAWLYETGSFGSTELPAEPEAARASVNVTWVAAQLEAE